MIYILLLLFIIHLITFLHLIVEVKKVEGGFLLVNKGMATVKIPQERSKSNPGRPIQLQYDQIAIGIAHFLLRCNH